MWDFKLTILDFLFLFNLYTTNFLTTIFDVLYPLMFKSFFLVNWSTGIYFPFNSSVIFGIKFCLCISFLILIRGGTPRYRYDYLTKLGWLKFLTLILLAFSYSILFYFIY